MKSSQVKHVLPESGFCITGKGGGDTREKQSFADFTDDVRARVFGIFKPCSAPENGGMFFSGGVFICRGRLPVNLPHHLVFLLFPVVALLLVLHFVLLLCFPFPPLFPRRAFFLFSQRSRPFSPQSQRL